MNKKSIVANLRLVATPFRIAGAALMQGRIAAALFLFLTFPVFIVMSLVRRKSPRKAKDSAFTYTMR